jgi:deoxyribodipyrimidine photo-lyase
MSLLSYEQLLDRIDGIDPVDYGRTRNFLNGHVTRLSPYISRGVISTKTVFERVRNRGFSREQLEPFAKELAWRDYWQEVWAEKGEGINEDLRTRQSDVKHVAAIPDAVLNACTGVEGVDSGIRDLLEKGYVHNHQRMYIASVVCNLAGCHWLLPARWMYYHLLDGDWGSNALSWQWVAGTNSSKKYVANQENINRYCGMHQRNTFLDVSYETLPSLPVPAPLEIVSVPELGTTLPSAQPLQLSPTLPVVVYTGYNLDPLWRKSMPANRVLLLEPGHFENYPVSPAVMAHILALAGGIEDLQVFTGSFRELKEQAGERPVFYREHPFSRHFNGIEDASERLSAVKGYFPSFFAFWKKAQQELFPE